MNVAFSPVSIWRALNMIIYGASGNTKEEIESVLNLKGIDNATKAMKDMKEIMSNGTKIAERIWIEDSFTILDSFKEKFGQIESGGFKDSPEKTRSIINQWVEKQTNNQIKDLFPEGTINELTRLVLVNALSFKGIWKTPFKIEDTHKQEFYLEGGTQKKVDVMFRNDKFNIIKEEGNLFVEIPYENDEFTFIVTLPEKGVKINEFVKNQDPSKFQELLKRLNKRVSEYLTMDSDLFLPKFDIDHKVDLKEMLDGMGVRDLFTQGKADLSGITGDRNLYCSSAFHQVAVKVDEEGTKAEAATGFGMAYLSMPPQIRINRPFLFHVLHRNTGLILFAGVIKDLD